MAFPAASILFETKSPMRAKAIRIQRYSITVLVVVFIVYFFELRMLITISAHFFSRISRIVHAQNPEIDMYEL